MANLIMPGGKNLGPHAFVMRLRKEGGSEGKGREAAKVEGC